MGRAFGSLLDDIGVALLYYITLFAFYRSED